MDTPPFPSPQPTLSGVVAYAVPRHPAPTDLDLSGNLGPALDPDRFPTLCADDLRSYPDARPLEAALAARLGLSAAQVVVTAGADDAIDRLCRAVLGPGRQALLTEPGFLVTTLRARLAGAEVLTIPWPGSGPFPTETALAKAHPAASASPGPVALVVVTSPNNPTGAVAAAADLAALSAAFPSAVLLVDLAYTEYADEDLTTAALSLPNAVITRTLSKAWGLAGLRVGYAASASPTLIDWLRIAGMPYTISAPALRLAQHWLAAGGPTVERHVAWVRHARAVLTRALREVGAEVVPSQANFVFCRHLREGWLRDGLAGLGIAVRAFPESPTGGLRLGCPPDTAGLARVERALLATLRPVARTLPDTPPVPGGWALCKDEAEIRAARAVGAVPLGWGRDPGGRLLAAGAARILTDEADFLHKELQ